MNAQPDISADRLRRFEAKFIPEPMSGCWLWIGGVNEHGYGVFWNGERLEKAHRFSLRAYRTAADAGDDVLHNCDNPSCVNPDHLRPGSAKANVDDMWRRNRAVVRHLRGTAQAQAKLDDISAIEIRQLWATGRYKQRDLAVMYGVSQRLVWNVVHNRNWSSASGVVVRKGVGKC